MSSTPPRHAPLSRNHPQSADAAPSSKAQSGENGVEQVGGGNGGRASVEQTSRREGEEVNRGTASSGSDTSTNHAGLRDEERATGNDRELAANNAPERSSAAQPGKSLGGISND